MKRVLSQYICINANDMRRRTVVEFDQDDTVVALYSMDQADFEPSNTLFFDGIISGELLDENIELTPDSDVFEFIGTHAKSIILGEKNRLILWKNVDFAQKKIGHKCKTQALKAML